MFVPADPLQHPPIKHAWVIWLRPALIVLLLVGELVGLSLLVDTGEISVAPGLQPFLHFAPAAASFFIATLAGLVIFCGAQWQSVDPRYLAAPRYWQVFLLAHFVALAIVVAVTLQFDAGQGTLSAALIATALIAGAMLLFTGASAALAPAASWKLGQTIAPAIGICFVIAAAAIAMGSAARWLWEPLGTVVLAMVSALLSLFGTPVVDPATMTIGLRDFAVVIAPACSGFEGLALVTAFIVGYLLIARGKLRFPRALWLLPIGLVLIWLTNVLRIAALVVLGAFVSPEIAMGAFHSQAGWIAFNLVALGLIAWSNYSPYWSNQPTTHISGEKSTNPAIALVAPFFAFTAAALLTSAISTGPSLWYGLRVIAAGLVLYLLSERYEKLNWRVSWEAPLWGAAAFLIWILLIPRDPAADETFREQITSLTVSQRMVFFGLKAIGYLGIAPLVEELAFRGYLTRRLIASDFDQVPLGRFSWLALIASSLLFGVAHGAFWLPATMAGLLYAAALYRRGSLGDAVCAHATTNALVIAYVAMTGRWSVWG